MAEKERYYALDALRGLSIILMIGHHFAFDLVGYGLLPDIVTDNFILNFFQPIFASIFVMLSGASSRFSHNNLARGIKILIVAALVSLVTYIFDPSMMIKFGILHFLGIASLLYHLLQPLLDKLHINGIFWLAAFVLAWQYFPHTGSVTYLWPLGVVYPGFSSADYYPLLPWIFIYFFGAWFADIIKAHKLPQWFYSFRCGFFEKTGFYSLWIYVLHQPILMGITLLLVRLKN